ncbi:MAG TPA: PEP-CTERM sorting domain-containing protein [Bryobacteraceae bacterium]|jgi:hypothetical protein
MRLLSVAFSVVLLTISGDFVRCRAQDSGGTLTLTNGGTLTGTGTIGGAVTVNSGLTFNGAGSILNLNTSIGTSTTLGQLTINSGVVNAVTFNGVASGSIVLSSAATFANSGTLTLTNATALTAGTLSAGPFFLNNGAALTLNSGVINNAFGRSLVLNGSSPLIFAGSTTPITLASGGTLVVNAGAATTNTVAGGTLTLNGTLPTLILPGNSPITIPANGTLTLNSGAFTAGGGTLTLTGTAPSVLLTNGFLAGATGTLTLNGGTLIPSGGMLNLTGASTITLTQGATPINATALGVPVATQLTINVAAGSSFGTLPAVGNINVASGTVASFLGGVNANGGSVSLLYLPAVQNLVSNPLQLHVSEFDNGTHGKYVLEMSYNPATAAALGNAIDNYLAWFDPSDGTWKNAVFGNSDGGASAHFVNGAYDATTDFHLGWYGIDPTNDEVWAVVDHNSTFGVANEDVEPTGAPDTLSPTGVPEPSTLGLLVGGLALLGRRRRKE